jgi:regulation of enolase protein 1 (concanavalin A-like superfamily)
MEWINEPARWSLADGVVTVTADSGTDFWRTTHYGYVHDNGHVYGETVDSDFDLTMLVRGAYADQYDQAGAMVLVDEQHWLKTGIEFVDGRIRLSTVITLTHSSWTVAELPAGTVDLHLQLARRGDSVEVRFGVDGDVSDLLAVVYLPPGQGAFAGAMCAAPVGDGFEVSFHDLAITTIAESQT